MHVHYDRKIGIAIGNGVHYLPINLFVYLNFLHITVCICKYRSQRYTSLIVRSNSYEYFGHEVYESHLYNMHKFYNSNEHTTVYQMI